MVVDTANSPNPETKLRRRTLKENRARLPRIDNSNNNNNRRGEKISVLDKYID